MTGREDNGEIRDKRRKVQRLQLAGSPEECRGEGHPIVKLCEIIEAVWYDGAEQVINYDWCDTVGKGIYGCVGYMNEAWHDNASDYTHDSDIVKEVLEDIYG